MQWQVICRGAYQELKILQMGIGKAPFCSQHRRDPSSKKNSKESFAGLGGKSSSSKSGRREFEPGQAPISLSSSKLERRDNLSKMKFHLLQRLANQLHLVKTFSHAARWSLPIVGMHQKWRNLVLSDKVTKV